MYDPRIYLSLDTCFAKKRWAMPEDWAPVIADLGISCVELSADTEADPMYMGHSYLQRWDESVSRACERWGLKVASLYSGHGSYTTLGLLHPDTTVVERLLSKWVFPAIHRSSRFGAAFGFFFHAVTEGSLHNRELYDQEIRRLNEVMMRVADEAARCNPTVPVALEQMYTPNQPPWRIEGSRKLLQHVHGTTGSPLYITVDTGHAWAQRAFVGSTGLHQAVAEDADPYAWLAALGAWSPIIHLQQTDLLSSSHRPFTAAENKRGVIAGDRVLSAIAESVDAVNGGGARILSTPPSSDLFLTLEMFAGTADDSRVLLDSLEDSVRYWRHFIPEDGLPLSQLMKHLPPS